MAKRKYRYTQYWRWIPVKMIQAYPAIKKDNSIQAQIFVCAIEKAIKATEEMRDGEARLRAVEMVYIDKSHNIDGAAAELFVSRRTAQRWLSNFCMQVARNAGYTGEK